VASPLVHPLPIISQYGIFTPLLALADKLSRSINLAAIGTTLTIVASTLTASEAP
jgi:hypothetical protein